MNALKANLTEAKKIYEVNHPRWTMHQSVDYSIKDDAAYYAVMKALKAAMPQVPKPDPDVTRWSHTVGFDAIIALFDRAIAAQEA